MDQFSSQLANSLENGYTFGVPEHLIQIYKELSSWCELIQYKIDVDINTQDDIRKQVLSNNLLKHIQGLWQENVSEFYSIRRDETRNNLSKAFHNRINNRHCQKLMEEENDVILDDHLCQEVYNMPNNEEYFNDNDDDSLSLEENYYFYQKYNGNNNNNNNIPNESITEGDPSKMVVFVKYNTELNSNNNNNDDTNCINIDDEYEFDYGNDNDNNNCIDNDEYDDYDLHHYKEASVTKVNIIHTNNEEKDGMINDYNSNSNVEEFYDGSMAPSLPDWSISYKEISPNEASCNSDYLYPYSWENSSNSFNEYYHSIIKMNMNQQLSYAEKMMKETIIEEEEEEEEEEDDNNNNEKENNSYTEELIREQKKLYNTSLYSPYLNDNSSNEIHENMKDENRCEGEINEDDDEFNNTLTNEMASLSLKSDNEINSNDNKIEEEEKEENEKEKENIDGMVNYIKNEKHRLSITTDESVINRFSRNENDSKNDLIEDEVSPQPNYKFKEHLYPRTIKSRDIYYDNYGEDSPSADSIISPNEELLLSSTSEDEEYEYSSGKVLMTPLSSSVLSYAEEAFISVDNIQQNHSEEEMKEEEKEKLNLNKNVELPPMGNIKDQEQENKENFAKYLSSRRDSGFSETCNDSVETLVI